MLMFAIPAQGLPAASRRPTLARPGRATNALATHGGTALITYRARGATRHVLAWGAVNALTPGSGKPQVRFKHDYSGGLHSLHRAAWVSFVDQCRLPGRRVFRRRVHRSDPARTDLQRWQRNRLRLQYLRQTGWQRAWSCIYLDQAACADRCMRAEAFRAHAGCWTHELRRAVQQPHHGGRCLDRRPSRTRSLHQHAGTRRTGRD